MTNYYKILGVKDFASKEDIKTAYRKLSKKFHPDVNDGDEFFAEKFKEIQEAYEHLTDDLKKRKHDDQLNNYFGKSKENFHEPKSNKQTNDDYNPFETKTENKKNDSKVKASKTYYIFGIRIYRKSKRIVIICLIIIAVVFLVYYYNIPKDREINNSMPIDNTAATNNTVKIEQPYLDNNPNKTEIDPVSNTNQSYDTYYTIGSSKNAVLRIQGNPSQIINAGSTVMWYYGTSSVTFENGKVSEFSNIGGNLKIKLIDERNRTLDAENIFSIGSSKNTVLQIQGNPSQIINAGSTVMWYYGTSSVTFENGKVSEFSNIGQNLKIKL
jgi:curved DNA-binding protein CbpA